MVDHDPRFGPEPSRTAYAAGCRCEPCRAANTAYARDMRARARAKLTDAASPWSGDASGREREPTGEPCPQCGTPSYWTTGRAGQVCDNGHWQLPPLTAVRIADAHARTERHVNTDKQPSVMDIAMLDRQRDMLINRIEAMLNELDLTQLEELHYDAHGVNTDSLQYARSVFGSLVRQAHQAGTVAKLTEIENAMTDAYQQCGISTLQMLVSQAYSDAVQQLSNRYYGQRQFQRVPGRNAITEVTDAIPGKTIQGQVLATPASIARQQWRAQPRAIAPYTPEDEDGEEDYAEDEEDYDEENYYRPRKPRQASYDEDHSRFMLYAFLAICAIGISYAAWGKYTHRGLIKCAYEHKMRPGLGRREYRDQYDTNAPFIVTCARNKCNKRAVQQFRNPVYYELRDENGTGAADAGYQGVRET